MSLIVKDAEIVRAGRMISSTMEEIVELNKSFNQVLVNLTSKGIVDEEISVQLLNRKESLTETITHISRETENVMKLVNSYINEIDEKDSYLF